MIKLQHFSHLRDDPRVKFKTEIVNGRELTIVCYMIADVEFWKQPLALECRGIVFDSITGECICRPFEKFFNVGENAWTQVGELDFTGCNILEKRDGSMLTPALVDGAIFWKTKKSFTSDVAISAAKNASEKLNAFCIELMFQGYTPIFEYTDQQHQIVIDYGNTPEFTLLAVRDMATGAYMDYTLMCSWAIEYKIPYIQRYPMSAEKMFEQMATKTDFEGYVVALQNGMRVKQKTDWYFRMHVIMTQMRERDVAEAVINETIDDIKSAVSKEGKDITPLIEIETGIVTDIEHIRLETENLAKRMKELETRKDIALRYRIDPYFSLAIKLYDGQEPDYKKYWKDKYLKSYSLRTIYNTSFSGDE